MMRRLDGSAFLAAAAFAIAGGIVAALDSAAPFGHGAWLAAFLVLVGGVARALLVAGRSALGAAAPSHRVRDGQVARSCCGTSASSSYPAACSPALPGW